MLDEKIKKKLYGVWEGIKQRCNNPNQPAYKHYGARGITMCEEWSENFNKFYIWALDNGYKEGLSIDRIDVDKGYSPENCRWADRKTQMNNRRNSFLITYNGEIKSITEWAKQYGLKRATIQQRLDTGCELDRLFLSIEEYKKTSEIKHGTLIEYLKEASLKNGLSVETMKYRIYKHKVPLEKAILPEKEYAEYRKLNWKKTYTYNGETLFLKEWAEKYNMKPKMLYNRICRDKSPLEKALLSKEDYHKYRMGQKHKKKEEF